MPNRAVARSCIASSVSVYYIVGMKTLTVRLPDSLAAEIEAESRKRGVSKSDIVRERLARARAAGELPPELDDIADLIGIGDGLPSDVSARKKDYLRLWGYGGKRRR
jgi:Arc/MetJ-type ribon-helix-helix transcriptional regulator